MSYSAPTASTLKARYPAFAAVADATVDYWLTDSLRNVDSSWLDGDRAVAMMALAAHNMALGGLGTDAAAQIPAGVTSFRSGSFSASIADAAAAQSVGSGYASTRYGREFRMLLGRSKGGPRATTCP